MVERWFISDHHLWHENIIRFSNRPFKDVKSMNECLLDFHNQFVKPNHHVSFLGDVTLRRGGRIEREEFVKEIKKYNGHKRLFLGNHDHFPAKIYLEAGFEKIYATWRDEHGILFSHIPVHPSSMGSAKANVHGHIHNNQGDDFRPVLSIHKDTGDLADVKPYVNVSCEVINYRPINYDELLVKIKDIVNGKDPTV